MLLLLKSLLTPSFAGLYPGLLGFWWLARQGSWCQQGELPSCLCCGCWGPVLGDVPSVCHLPFAWGALSGWVRSQALRLNTAAFSERWGWQMPKWDLQAAARILVPKRERLTWGGAPLTSRVNLCLNPLALPRDLGWKAAASSASSAVRSPFLDVFS